MKVLRWTLLVWFLVLPFNTWAKSLLPISHWVTKNGARVYFVPVATADLPILDVNVVFAAGSARDGKHAGLAHLTSALMLQGSEGYTVDQVAEQFEQWGVQVSTGVDHDKAILQLRTLVDKKLMNPALKLFAHVIAHPVFNNIDFEREQSNTLTAIKQQQQEPANVADNRFFYAIYGDHAYGHPVLGTAQTVTALHAKQCFNFHQNYYVAKNAVITLVGSISEKEAKQIAEQLVAQLPAGKKAIPLTKLPVLKRKKNA